MNTVSPDFLVEYAPAQQLSATGQIAQLVQMSLVELLGAHVVRAFKGVGSIEITAPKDPTHGEYATTIALSLWKHILQAQSQELLDAQHLARKWHSPQDLASAIAHHLNTHYVLNAPKPRAIPVAHTPADSELAAGNVIPSQKETLSSMPPVLAQVMVAGPGFINFTLSQEYVLYHLHKSLISIGRGIDLPHIVGQRIMVEFTDPNPFKELHIGHLYSNTIGEAIANILQYCGAQVQRVCYQGDVGMHVAKSIWGLQHNISQDGLGEPLAGLTQLQKKKLSEKIAYLGRAYATGATAYTEDEQARQRIQTINFGVYMGAQRYLVEHQSWQPQIEYAQHASLTDQELKEITELYQAGREWSLEYFDSIYTRVGMKFDDFYFESIVGEYGVQIVREYLAKGVFEESQGAIIFPGEKYGLHNRVFINSLGLPTYEAKELGLAGEKYHRFAYDTSLIITGNEIDEYFKVLLKALEAVRPELAHKTVHMSHGMVRLPDGKMSSRTGKVLTAEWLLDEAHQRVLAMMQAEGKTLPAQPQEVAEKVGQAAIKYAFLKSAVGKDIAFSFDESLQFGGYSGPYLQYTYARCKSILRKAEQRLLQAGLLSDEGDAHRTINMYIDTLLSDLKYIQIEKHDKDVLLYIEKWYDVINKVATEYAPHHLCTYLFELAQVFNIFYTHCVVVPDEWQPTTRSVQAGMTEVRLAMVILMARVLQEGLGLLGIEVLEEM